MNSGTRFCPTHRPSSAASSSERRSVVEPEADDDLVLRLLDLDLSLEVVAERGADGLLVERRPFRAAPVLEDDGAPVPLLELLVRERPPILRQQLREPFEQRFWGDLLEPERNIFLHQVLPRPNPQLPSLLVREAVHELDQHRRRQRDEAELLAVGIPLDELPKGTVDERVHACVALFGKVPQTFVRVLLNPDGPCHTRLSWHEPALPHAS